jgi:hypothetical protein
MSVHPTPQPLKAKDYAAYSSFLLAQPTSLFYASLKYRSFLEDLLRCQSHYCIVKDCDTITAALPLMFRDGSLGRVYNSLPYYGSNGGIVARSANEAAYLIATYNDIVSKETVAASNLIANPLDRVDYTGLSHDVTDGRIGQFTPLLHADEPGDAFMQAFHSKTRNMIRKAQKAGITVEVNNAALDFVQETHGENMAAIGGRAKSPRFFDLVDKHFQAGSDYRIYVARAGTETIAAALLFYFNKTVEYFTPVIKEAYRSLQPLSLIIFQAMIEAAQMGYDWWNWGGTWNSQQGVYRFKSRWNTTDIDYTYYVKINRAELYTIAKERLLEEYDGFFTIPFHLQQRCA